jgi:glycosyltransferase involved in cell wall biosynthesis
MEKTQKSAGGTEILRAGLSKHTAIDERDINVILCKADYSEVKFSKQNILWQHNNYSDGVMVSNMADPSFMKAIDATVYVSHWQFEKYRYLFRVPTENAFIIRNAIEPIELKPKPKDKLKLIYTSTPFRGLNVLLDAFELLNRDDIELDVYSSTIIYGSGFQEYSKGMFDDLFDRAKNIPGVNYHGFVPNTDIHKALQEAHIFAYPSIWEETACLAMIEAGAAGLSLVTTDLGALPETGSMYANMIPVQADMAILTKNYAKALEHAIDTYWDNLTQEKLKEQSEFYNKYYSWEVRAKEWEQLFDYLQQV